LANIFAHYAVDIWFRDVVVKYCKGGAHIIRYADDMVICCKAREDANRIVEALKKRMKRFGLELSEEKTKIVSFNYKEANSGKKQETFDFLGFTFYIGKSQKGRPIRKVRTAGKRMRSKLKNVNLWCERGRHVGSLLDKWKIFCSKMRGHIQYYSVSFNTDKVQSFVDKSIKIFFKWMNRRSQKKSLNWNEFNRFLKNFPLPKVVVKHRLF
jgi:RNA-directed DNA polymerase